MTSSNVFGPSACSDRAIHVATSSSEVIACLRAGCLKVCKNGWAHRAYFGNRHLGGAGRETVRRSVACTFVRHSSSDCLDLAHLVVCVALHLYWKGVFSIFVSATVRASDVVGALVFCSHGFLVKVQSLRQSGERVCKSTFASLTNSLLLLNCLRDSTSSPNCSFQGSRQ